MTLESILAGSQILAIVAIVIGACVGPLFYTMWQNRKNK